MQTVRRGASGAKRCEAVRSGAKRCEAVRSGAKRCETVRSGANGANGANGAKRCEAVRSGAKRSGNAKRDRNGAPRFGLTGDCGDGGGIAGLVEDIPFRDSAGNAGGCSAPGSGSTSSSSLICAAASTSHSQSRGSICSLAGLRSQQHHPPLLCGHPRRLPKESQIEAAILEEMQGLPWRRRNGHREDTARDIRSRVCPRAAVGPPSAEDAGDTALPVTAEEGARPDEEALRYLQAQEIR